MSEQNMETVRKLLEEVWTRGNLALLPELMAEDAVCRPMPQLEALHGPSAYQDFIAVYKGVFLEMVFKLEDQFAAGDKVATRWTAAVTDDQGNAEQDAASGEQLRIDGITITHHDSSGKIVAEWATWDTHGLLQGVGAPRVFEQLAVSL